MWRVYAIITLIVLTLGGAGYVYFDWSQKKMAELNQNIAEKDIAIAEQDQAIGSLNGRIGSVQGAYSDYNSNVNRHRTESAEMAEEITNPEINGNASTQPRETEAVINNFTANLFNQFEMISRGHTQQVPQK